ncbi:acyloxyacyl hydrolase [Flavihumibacter sp. R14]|nr:acyloxyacyl hydrolase [Flavihumibacter soli]
MKRHTWIFFLFALLTETLYSYKASAQNSDPAYIFEGRVVVGSHMIGGKDALQDRLYGLDLSYNKDLSHLSDNWVKLARASAVGISFIFRDLQDLKGHEDTSANSFGQAYGVSAHIDFRLLKAGETTFTLRPAVGLSYLTKTFFTNRNNRFIGSHLNEILKLDLLMQMPVSPKVDLTVGAGFLHYSNGGYSIPNAGLNVVSVSTGFRFKRIPLEKKEYHSNFHQLNRNNFELNLGIGRRGISESRKGLLKSGFYAGYNFFLNDLISFKSGFDAVYYYTPFDPAPGRSIETYQKYATSYDKWRAGVSVGPEMTIWRLALNAQVGKYLHYNSFHKKIKWFWTSGLTYYVAPRVGLQAKTYFHVGQADFINYGLVFKL